jgi:protein-S-isoprenylcysteine O-methyltransferase Ste14
MTEKAEKGAAVRVPPPAVFGGLTAVALVLHFFVRPWPTSLALDQRLAGGAALAIVGLAIGMSAFKRFRATGQDPAPWKPTPSLIVTGAYRFTRNPMYVGLVLLTSAIALFANASWCMFAGPIALVIVHITSVRPEEAYLRGKFGKDYEAYCKRVPRYL